MFFDATLVEAVLHDKPSACLVSLLQGSWMAADSALCINSEEAERFVFRYTNTSEKCFCGSITATDTYVAFHSSHKQ
jgi:hypothetical protein